MENEVCPVKGLQSMLLTNTLTTLFLPSPDVGQNAPHGLTVASIPKR